jgi:uncharacterized membrane protein
MELFVEHLDHILADFVSLLSFVLETIAALTILVGLIRTAQMLFRMRMGQPRRQPILGNPTSFIRIRITFGMSLALALEFQLGADILATTISPNFEALGILGAIALIRTFLNYFLNKELEAEYESHR